MAVVDMFNGTGTTGKVALDYNKRYLGYELRKVYLKFSEIKLSQNHNTYSSRLIRILNKKINKFPLRPCKHWIFDVSLFRWK